MGQENKPVFGNHSMWADQGLTQDGGQGEDRGCEGDRCIMMSPGTVAEVPRVHKRVMKKIWQSARSKNTKFYFRHPAFETYGERSRPRCQASNLTCGTRA